MKTFTEYSAEGDLLEDFLEDILSSTPASYRRIRVVDGDLTEQHNGDFFLEKAGVYLECKHDLLAAKSGNAYLEVGEVRNGRAPKDPFSIQPVGVFKQAAKKPTVFVHQVGPDLFLVYSARKMARALLSCPRECRWVETADAKAGRLDKHNVGVLLGRITSTNVDLIGTIHRADAGSILECLRAAVRDELAEASLSERALISAVRAFSREEAWREKGWHQYSYVVK